MATNTTAGIATTGHSNNFPGVITEIEEAAYKLQYETNLLRPLVRKIGAKGTGGWVHFPYFDPTTLATSASTLTVEGHDFTNWTQLANASVIIVASNFIEGVFVTDKALRGASLSLVDEASRQLGLGMGVKADKHILKALAGAFTAGTITGTNATTGFSYAKYAAALSVLSAKTLTVPKPFIAVVPEYSWNYTQQGTWSSTYASAMGSVGDAILNNYYKQRLFGQIDVYTVPLGLIAASGTAAGVLYAKEGCGLWIDRDFKLETQRDASKQGEELVATMWAGAKGLVSGYGVPLVMYALAPS